jgi:hypothetical protein
MTLSMTAYNFGDVILIGFPHTDLRNVSKRPALVIYDADDQDILVARITTQEYITRADYNVKATRFKNSRKKAAYSYMLTPQGIEEKSLMLVQFLRRKKSEYQLLEQEIARLTQELDAHNTTEPLDRS